MFTLSVPCILRIEGNNFRTISVQGKASLDGLLKKAKGSTAADAIQEAIHELVENTDEVLKRLNDNLLVVNVVDEICDEMSSNDMLNMLGQGNTNESFCDSSFESPLYSWYDPERNTIWYNSEVALKTNKSRFSNPFKLKHRLLLVKITKYSKMLEKFTLQDICGEFPAICNYGRYYKLPPSATQDPMNLIRKPFSPTTPAAMKSVKLLRLNGNKFSKINLYDYYESEVKEK